MTEFARAYVSPTTVTGLCAAVLLWAALDLTGAATGAESMLAGLIAMTAALVLDSSVRAERRFRLRGLLEAADWLPGAVASLAGTSREIVEQHPAREIITEARRRLQQVTEDFEELAQGRIVRPGHDFEFLMAGTDACHRRLQAIANVPAGAGGLRWWDSEAGRRYWEANLDALSRGVAITRLFVCGGIDADLADLIALQRRAGVRTMMVTRDAVDPVPPLDLVLWDGRRGWEARMNAHGDRAANVFTVNERDLQRLTGAFDSFAGAARPVGD